MEVLLNQNSTVLLHISPTASLFYEVLSDCDFTMHTPKKAFVKATNDQCEYVILCTHFYGHFRFSQFSYFVNADTIRANKCFVFFHL